MSFNMLTAQVFKEGLGMEKIPLADAIRQLDPDSSEYDCKLTCVSKIIGGKIPKDSAALLANILRKNTTLTALNLQNSFMSQECVMEIIGSLTENTTLVNIDISHNPFRKHKGYNRAVQLIVETLAINTTLMHLWINRYLHPRNKLNAIDYYLRRNQKIQEATSSGFPKNLAFFSILPEYRGMFYLLMVVSTFKNVEPCDNTKANFLEDANLRLPLDIWFNIFSFLVPSGAQSSHAEWIESGFITLRRYFIAMSSTEKPRDKSEIQNFLNNVLCPQAKEKLVAKKAQTNVQANSSQQKNAFTKLGEFSFFGSHNLSAEVESQYLSPPRSHEFDEDIKKALKRNGIFSGTTQTSSQEQKNAGQESASDNEKAPLLEKTEKEPSSQENCVWDSCCNIL